MFVEVDILISETSVGFFLTYKILQVCMEIKKLRIQFETLYGKRFIQDMVDRICFPPRIPDAEDFNRILAFFNNIIYMEVPA